MTANSPLPLSSFSTVNAMPGLAAPMAPIGRAHLCLVQPRGRVEALAALDAARWMQRQLAAIGVPASLARNRLRADAVNLVFGAAWGFDADAAQGRVCALVDALPTLGGGPVSAPLRRLMQRLPVVPVAGAPADLGAPRLPAWQPLSRCAPLAPGLPLAQRPIELLVLQPLTPRRAQWIARIEASGCRVARIESTLVADERAALVRQARAVLLLRGADGEAHDSVAAALALAEGTPVLVDGDGADWPDADTAPAVLPIGEAALDDFFATRWRSGAWLGAAEAALDFAARHDAAASLRQLWAALQALAPLHSPGLTPVRRISSDTRFGTPPGWSLDPAAVADPVAAGPRDATSSSPESVDLWRAGHVDLTQPATRALCQRAFAGLRPGGTLVLEAELPANARGVVHEMAATLSVQLQDLCGPGCGTAVLTHRLDLSHCGWLDEAGRPTPARQARRARLVLTKVDTTYRERSLARAQREDFGLGDVEMVADIGVGIGAGADVPIAPLKAVPSERAASEVAPRLPGAPHDAPAEMPAVVA